MGYRGHNEWTDMSEYVVHFTRDEPSAYDSMLGILYEGHLQARNSFGAGAGLKKLGDSQRSACLSEVPLDLLARLVARRSKYGIGFSQEFIVARGGARVWYVDAGGPVSEQFEELKRKHFGGGIDADSPFWKLTPFVDFPSEKRHYRFEWEREWRVPGGFDFMPADVAFLFIPERLHGTARSFFQDAEDQHIGPNYQCPYLDPDWEMERIQDALRGS